MTDVLAHLHDPDAGAERPVTSWRPQQLDDVLAGPLERRKPDLLARTDGHHLLYRGLSSTLFGASESAKSWIALLGVVEAVKAGEHAVIVDLESDVVEIATRLRALGLSDAAIRDRVAYIRPDEPLGRILDGPAAPATATDHDLADALATRPAIVVIDAMTELYSLHGLDPLSTRDAPMITGFLRRLANRTGAAVVSVDHVPHAPRDGGARAPLGSQHKRAAVTGVAYEVKATKPLAPGHVGKVSLHINKDRPGGVREHAAGLVAARISLDAGTHPTQIIATIDPAGDGPSEALHARMTEVSQALAQVADGLSKNRVRELVPGRAKLTDDALDRLVQLGHVERTAGLRGAIVNRHVSAYPPVTAPPDVPL